MANWRSCCWILLTFIRVWCLPLALAHDPIYRNVSGTTNGAPWKRYSNNQRNQIHRTDYSSRVLDFERAKLDPRARIYRVDFRSRKPNRNLSITSRIIAATVAMFGVQLFRPSVTPNFMKLSERIVRGEQLYRLVTPIFLHGSPFHLLTNMISLQRVGQDVERLFGTGRFLATYVAAGAMGNWISAIRSPNPSLGASGAVFGIVGAYFVFLNRNEWLYGDFGEAMTNSIVQTLAYNIFLGLVNPQIDQWAHIGGALGGGIMAYLFGPRLFLSELPQGRNVLIDLPILRAPKQIEQIPESVGRSWGKLTHSISRQMDRVLPQNTSPWQNIRRNLHGVDYRKRQQAPTRSIKPGKVD